MEVLYEKAPPMQSDIKPRMSHVTIPELAHVSFFDARVVQILDLTSLEICFARA